MFGLYDTPFRFTHKTFGWIIQLGFAYPNYTLEINGVKYEDMPEAPPKERAALARSAISMKMDGPKKSAKFRLLCNGEYIEVSILLDMLTKFAKLSVGKHIVSSTQR